MDKNFVHLEGSIGDDIKWGNADNGNPYCTFTLIVDSYFKETRDPTERDHSRTFIRVFVYGKPQLEYLKRVSVRQGNRASIFARLSSHKTEFGSKTIIQLNVVVRDITIIKTQ